MSKWKQEWMNMSECVWNSAVSSVFLLITKEILVCTKINIPYKCWKNIHFSIWRCKFDTDLVRSSLVYEMYYFEMPVGAEDVEYYSSSFLWDLNSLIPVSFVILSLLVLCKADYIIYICRVYPSSKHYSVMCKVVTVLLHFTDVFK